MFRGVTDCLFIIYLFIINLDLFDSFVIKCGQTVIKCGQTLLPNERRGYEEGTTE